MVELSWIFHKYVNVYLRPKVTKQWTFQLPHALVLLSTWISANRLRAARPAVDKCTTGWIRLRRIISTKSMVTTVTYLVFSIPMAHVPKIQLRNRNGNHDRTQWGIEHSTPWITVMETIGVQLPVDIQPRWPTTHRFIMSSCHIHVIFPP